jgi:hypothetical protein
MFVIPRGIVTVAVVLTTVTLLFFLCVGKFMNKLHEQFAEADDEESDPKDKEEDVDNLNIGEVGQTENKVARDNKLRAVAQAKRDINLSMATEELNVKVASNIVDVFNVTLERMPTPTELRKFHDFVVDGKMDYDKLKKVIEGSGEYARMVRTQTNLVNKDIVPVLTDRELDLSVQRLYQEVYGTVFKDEDRDFYLRRYQLLGQDDTKMLKFLTLLRDYDEFGTLRSFEKFAEEDTVDEEEEAGGAGDDARNKMKTMMQQGKMR